MSIPVPDLSDASSAMPSFDSDYERLARELSARTILFHQAVAERVGLSTTEHKCLDLLVRAHEPLTAGQLADLSGLTTGAITGIVDRLEAAGFVERVRSTEDRRKVHIHPLPALYTKYGHLMDGLARKVGSLLAGYSEAEQRLLFDYATKTIAILKEETVRLRELDSEID